MASVIDKPEYAALRVHTLDLDTMQPAPAELADETIPSAQDAQVLSRDVRQKVAAADLEWTADINPFHQPNMAQIQGAAARSR